MSARERGFRIARFEETSGYGAIDAASLGPLDRWTVCPAHDRPLAAAAVLVGHGGSEQITIGACPVCGYTAYVDRPSAAWFAAYYRESWDAASGRLAALDAEVEAARAHVAAHGLGPRHEVVEIAESLGLDRTRPVLDIGCGYGRTLAQLRQAGFVRPAGLEGSTLRARVAAATHDLPVASGPFEDPAVQQALEPAAPYGFIFIYHVLEHTHDPNQIVGMAARLQEPGDRLLVATPNVRGESSMGVLFFLPHLHSFSAGTLADMMARHGYDEIDTSRSTDEALVVIGRRAGTGAGRPRARDGAA
nr:class I SAM-dependent methyltransferase [Acidobacteriota bacterium]